MPIPPLDGRGLLPPGNHQSNLYELNAVFANNQRRESLFYNLESFINTELKVPYVGHLLTVGGSYLSDKPHPGDIEVVLQIDPVSQARSISQLASSGVLSQFDMYHNRIMETYEVDFYLDIAGIGNSLSSFFQYVGVKSAADKGLSPKDRRGVLEIII